MNRFRKHFRQAFAGIMAIWLSGAVFLILCHGQTGITMESCPLMRLGAHCDKADKEKDSEKVEKPINETGMDCCAFIPAFFDKTRTSHSDQQVAVAAPAAMVVRPRLVTVLTNFPSAYPYLSTVLSKNDTFLKNRTFRI